MRLNLPDLNYACLNCGKSCRQEWNIPASQSVAAGILGSRAAERVARKGFVPLTELDSGVRVLGHSDPCTCVFLEPDNLCALHAELGFEAKPRQCRQFPFLPIKTPDGFFVGLSFLCTAVQQSHGPSVRDQRPALEAAIHELIQDIGDSGELPRQLAIPVAGGLTISWPVFVELETFVEDRMRTAGSREGLWQAAAGLAMEAHHCLEQGLEISVDRLRRIRVAPPDGLAAHVLKLVQATIVALVEAPKSGRRRTVSEALLAGTPFESDRLARVVDPRLADLTEPAWLECERQRYLGHLVFRKYLLESDVLSRLTALAAIARVLTFYTNLEAAMAGRRRALREDYFHALDLVEGYVATHTDGLDGLLDAYQTAMLDLVSSAEVSTPRPDDDS